MIPLVGDPANFANAVWYGAEKDWVNSGLSSAAMVPLAGDLVLGGKLIKGGALLAKFDRLGNLINENEKIAKVLARGRQAAPGVYEFSNVKDLRDALRFGKTAANMEFRIGETGLTFATNAEGRLASVKVWVDGRWVTTGVRGRSLKLAEIKPGETAWDLIGMPRGQVIEDALAHSEYKGWEHVGAKRNGFYPTIDFLKDGKAVSLKTMDPPNPSGVRTIRKNIDALSKMQRKGFDEDGSVVRKAELDLRLRVGGENDPLVKQLVAFAATRKPPVEVSLIFA